MAATLEEIKMVGGEATFSARVFDVVKVEDAISEVITRVGGVGDVLDLTGESITPQAMGMLSYELQACCEKLKAVVDENLEAMKGKAR